MPLDEFHFFKLFIEKILEEPVSLRAPKIEPELVRIDLPWIKNRTREYVLIAPGGANGVENIPLALWTEVADYISKLGYDVIWTYSNDEEKTYCKEIQQACGNNGIMLPDLPETHLLEILKCSKLCIAGNKKISLFSAALRVRTINLSAQCDSSMITLFRGRAHFKNIFTPLNVQGQSLTDCLLQTINELLALPDVIFIHICHSCNTGDQMLCPLDIFRNYFGHLHCILQKFDIEELHTLKFKKALFIVGGGGIINQNDDWNDGINNLIRNGNPVIGWGIGFNQHYDRPVHTKILLNKFTLLGLRDFGKPYRYVPCPSCVWPQLNYTAPIQRRIGAVLHHGYLVDTFGYETMYNTQPFEDIIKFIAESEIILTNTYHIVYWSTLMGKRVILLSKSSNRFDSFCYPPTLFSGDLEKDIKRTKTYPHALEECRKLNWAYFEDVKDVIGKMQK